MKVLAAALLCAAGVAPAGAADFFDTSKSDQFLDIGFRLGVNTSNFTVDDGVFNSWNKNSWGTGFDAGVVASLNIRDYLAIQPGLFFESRSGSYSYITRYYTAVADPENPAILTRQANDYVQVGNTRTYNILIPIVANVRFNVTDDVRWSVDFGPYFNFRLKKSGSCRRPDFKEDILSGHRFVKAESNAFDFGFKMGCGLNIKQHYYIGVHYLAGALDVWKTSSMGGRNKGWQFTIGYDL